MQSIRLGVRSSGFKSWLHYLLAWESCSNLGESPHLNSLSFNRILHLPICLAFLSRLRLFNMKSYMKVCCNEEGGEGGAGAPPVNMVDLSLIQSLAQLYRLRNLLSAQVPEAVSMTHLSSIGSSLARSIARISLALGTFPCCFPKLTYTL